jgi:hypothetical protein
MAVYVQNILQNFSPVTSFKNIHCLKAIHCYPLYIIFTRYSEKPRQLLSTDSVVLTGRLEQILYLSLALSA